MTLKFCRDWAVHPGEVISEYMEHYEISVEELSRLTGIAPQRLLEVVNCRGVLEAEMAPKFEAALGISSIILLGIMRNWERFHQLPPRDRAA